MTAGGDGTAIYTDTADAMGAADKIMAALGVCPRWRAEVLEKADSFPSEGMFDSYVRL